MPYVKLIGVALFPLFVLPAVALETAVMSGIDKEHAAKISEQRDFSSIEDKIAQSFMEPITKGACFKATEYVKDKTQDARLLSAAGYDAVIRMDVREISVQRAIGDYVSLSAHVHGQMVLLTSGKIVWDREEFVSSPELHSFDYYKENGLKELEAMLEKAGKILAYDFIYLK